MKRFFIAMTMAGSVQLSTAAVIDSTKVYDIDEIEVVSTPKESGSMRRQPSAVSLVSSKQLADNHVVSLKGVSALVPNFFMPDYGSRLTSAVYIRGIGSRMNTPAVGMYVDNIPYVDKSAFDFNFFDIERVDVLRGPQGTLYGRNAMGGIIKVHTRSPFRYHGTDVKMSYATGDSHSTLSFTHYHQPTSTFAFSAGGYAELSDGSFTNATTGKKVDGMKAGGGRVRGIYIPVENLKLDLSLGYDYTDEGAYPYYYTGTLKGDEQYADQVGKITNNRESRYRRGMFNAGLNMEYHAPEFVLNAVTGYQNLNDRMFLDQDFIAADIYSLEQKQRVNTLSEEITIKSRPGKTWEWLNGVNVMYQTLHTTGPVTFYEDGVSWLEKNINSNLPQMPQMAINLRDSQMQIGGVFDTPMFNAALFHQSTVHLTEGLSATLGLRVDNEHNTLDYSAPANINYGFSMPQMKINLQDLSSVIKEYEGTMSRNYWQFLPKVALKYEFNSNSNIYLSAAKGMRSGGYNVQMFSDIIQGAMQKKMMDGVKEAVFNYLDNNMPMMADKLKPVIEGSMPKREMPSVGQVSYKPEYSWNYEAGAHLSFPEARLQLDAAVFYVDTRDQQIARFAESGLGRMMVNAGKSESYGAEASVSWNPVEALALVANYGYTHAKFTDYDGGVSGDEKIDWSGNYVPFVPMHTLNLDAAYTFRMPSCFINAMTIGANYTGAGKMYWTEDNAVSQNFYSLLGARLAFQTKHADITLWAKNITDTKYNTFYFESAGRGFEQHGKPFQAGVDLKLHF